MFESIDYLQYGNEKQQFAYQAIRQLGVMEDLAAFKPILCGTLPIGIDVEGSDLDVIMEVTDFFQFEKKVKALYRGKEQFRLKRRTIRGLSVIKANFIFQAFEFELFGQPQPVQEQYAYLHMVIEHSVLEQQPHLREAVIALKEKGYKTEPAFCKILGLAGDPYEALVEFGKQNGLI
ncbi:DUF4269 domain-containing protein [Bacillus shivajii]|uniref:DUF4269 domain-containing protein n=1 Tax=Bacillus shivajii TaxID=1983719 RepID=UPI001CFB1DBB|nr:DUF4269 domain-containing protein [Bacillus shivajii]UCZ53439.1 DUF4269 domain-containing protein [Bacillus shivajii]